MNIAKHSVSSARQTGSVLIASLIMLMLLTLLAVSSMNSSTFQEKMTLNSHEYALGFAAAESGVRDGEYWLDSNRPNKLAVRPVTGTGNTATNCSSLAAPAICQVWASNQPRCPQNPLPAPQTADYAWDMCQTGSGRYQAAAWWSNAANPHSYLFGLDPVARAADGRAVPLVASQPRYVVELVGSACSSGGVDPAHCDQYEYYYQVTSRGVARTNQSALIVQSVVGRIF